MTGNRGGEISLLTAHRRAGLTLREVWIRYLALGGNADEASVDAQVHGVLDLAPGEYNVLAHALNEALDELGDARARGRVVPRHPDVAPGSADGAADPGAPGVPTREDA